MQESGLSGAGTTDQVADGPRADPRVAPVARELDLPEADPASSPRQVRWRRRRGQRVVLLLILLWILNGFDLAFTIMAHRLGDFNEGNPIARNMLHQPIRVIVFKVSSVVFASGIFFLFRDRGLVEAGCWGLCLVYAAIGFLWLLYYNEYEAHLHLRWGLG